MMRKQSVNLCKRVCWLIVFSMLTTLTYWNYYDHKKVEEVPEIDKVAIFKEANYSNLNKNIPREQVNIQILLQ